MSWLGWVGVVGGIRDKGGRGGSLDILLREALRQPHLVLEQGDPLLHQDHGLRQRLDRGVGLRQLVLEPGNLALQLTVLTDQLTFLLLGFTLAILFRITLTTPLANIFLIRGIVALPEQLALFYFFSHRFNLLFVALGRLGPGLAVFGGRGDGVLAGEVGLPEEDEVVGSAGGEVVSLGTELGRGHGPVVAPEVVDGAGLEEVEHLEAAVLGGGGQVVAAGMETDLEREKNKHKKGKIKLNRHGKYLGRSFRKQTWKLEHEKNSAIEKLGKRILSWKIGAIFSKVIDHALFYLRDRPLVRGVELLELPHPDVVDLDLVVGRADADAGARGVEVEGAREALALGEHVDGVAGPLVVDAHRLVVGARGHQAAVRGEPGERKLRNMP